MDSDRAHQLLAAERERIEREIAELGPEAASDRDEPGDRGSEDLYQQEFDAAAPTDLARAARRRRARRGTPGRRDVRAVGGERRADPRRAASRPCRPPSARSPKRSDSEADEPPMRLLLLAGPGGGKGTQGARLAERLEIAHVAAGDALRDEVARGTRDRGTGRELRRPRRTRARRDRGRPHDAHRGRGGAGGRLHPRRLPAQPRTGPCGRRRLGAARHRVRGRRLPRGARARVAPAAARARGDRGAQRRHARGHREPPGPVRADDLPARRALP